MDKFVILSTSHRINVHNWRFFSKTDRKQNFSDVRYKNSNRLLKELGRLSTFYTDGPFCKIQFPFLCTKPHWKRGLLQKERLPSLEQSDKEKIVQSRTSLWRQKHLLDRIASLESLCIPLENWTMLDHINTQYKESTCQKTSFLCWLATLLT